jgi:hypothetical protein
LVWQILMWFSPLVFCQISWFFALGNDSKTESQPVIEIVFVHLIISINRRVTLR